MIYIITKQEQITNRKGNITQPPNHMTNRETLKKNLTKGLIVLNCCINRGAKLTVALAAPLETLCGELDQNDVCPELAK